MKFLLSFWQSRDTAIQKYAYEDRILNEALRDRSVRNPTSFSFEMWVS